MKICLSCSVGGHLTQMRQLSKFYENHDYFFITEDSLITQKISKLEKMYLVRLLNRKKIEIILTFFENAWNTLRILRKEKPDIIISTGALSSVPCCLLGKLRGSKIIFIESFAKINSPTITGRIVYKIADLFIVQWEEMLRFYPKAKFGGSIY